MKMVHGSVFSGIGAAEIAAEMLGWSNAFHCEINPFGKKILDYYFPKAKSYEDITKTDFTEWNGKIDVLTGGFPCQPFSYAGKRRGSEDDRYLWPYMLRCIEQVRPRWFVGENVAGITTMVFPGEDVKVGEQTDLFGACDEVYEKHERYILDEICESLERAGYSVQPLIIPACAVGAPHRRDRVFIVAHRLTEDTLHSGLMGREHDEQGCERNIWDAGARGAERLCEQAMGGTCTDGQRPTTDTPSQRRREIYEQVQSKLADGAEPFGNGRKRNVTDTCGEGLEGLHESRSNEGEQRMQVRRNTTRYDRQDIEGMLPKNRWRTFPTVSPVYRGNDGLPFPVDDLAISFSEWKRESLKAYGNAIVPQVMYEIFRAIAEIENK